MALGGVILKYIVQILDGRDTSGTKEANIHIVLYIAFSAISSLLNKKHSISKTTIEVEPEVRYSTQDSILKQGLVLFWKR